MFRQGGGSRQLAGAGRGKQAAAGGRDGVKRTWESGSWDGWSAGVTRSRSSDGSGGDQPAGGGPGPEAPSPSVPLPRTVLSVCLSVSYICKSFFILSISLIG